MHEAKLIWEENGKDADGFPVKTEHMVETYCREKSATRQECYESMRAGVDVKTVLEIRQETWEKTRHIVNEKPEYARRVEYDECIYDIVRTYKIGKSKIEVVCA